LFFFFQLLWALKNKNKPAVRPIGIIAVGRLFANNTLHFPHESSLRIATMKRSIDQLSNDDSCGTVPENNCNDGKVGSSKTRKVMISEQAYVREIVVLDEPSCPKTTTKSNRSKKRSNSTKSTSIQKPPSVLFCCHANVLPSSLLFSVF
jgi:hypothetical protein